MQDLPHQYAAVAAGHSSGTVSTQASTAPDLQVSAPPQFGGPEGYWTPEEMFLAAIADCLVLSFRAIARASKLEWSEVRVETLGILDRVERHIKFTELSHEVSLTLVRPDDQALARRLLEKAERSCFISNTLNIECSLKLTFC